MTVVPTPVESITLSNSSLSLTEGETATLTAIVSPSDATDKSITWSSTDDSVAAVSSEGVVAAIKEGSATITAASSNGLTADCVVTVNANIIAVTAISINNTELNLIEGESANLTASISPADATDQTITWSSSNEGIAVVDGNGSEATVTALAEGYVEIYASASNGMTASCAVNVAAKIIEATEIILNASNAELKVGESISLSASVLPENTTDQTVGWSSSNEEVASVDANGNVTANALGEATITATCGNVSASCYVTVVPTPVESIIISETSISLIEGECATLTSTVSPAEATDPSVTWTSSDESVATVSAEGIIIAIKAGTATITAASSNGLTASCEVTVSAKIIDATEILLNASNVELKVGESVTLSATVLPEDTTDKTLVWTSSNEEVATVDANGNVTAIALGEATITATCGNASASCMVTVVPTPVESITLSNSSLSLTEGETATLTAIVSPSDATDKTVVWASSDDSVAAVSSEGQVTAIKEGSATITVNSSNGLTADCLVTVNANIISVNAISINNTELNLIEGETANLEASISPDDATDKTVTWTSSDEAIATVSADGMVTAVNAGKAIITASSSNGLTATCVVNVAAKIIEATEIVLSSSNAELKVGESITLTATILPEDTTDKTLVWSSSNEEVATVDDNGNVTANALGEAAITATCGNASATCMITVVPTPVESITISETSIDLIEGETATIVATVSPNDATDKTVTWTSSDEAVATVSAEGEVTAIKAGTATITAASSNGLTAECMVTVDANIISVTEITISHSELTLIEGETANLVATVSPDDATDKTVTWTSSDESVATVSAAGEVTAIKAGTATITAASSNGLTATCQVTVDQLVIEMEAIILNVESLDLEVGDTFQLTAEIIPADATYQDLEWWVDDDAIATVDQNGMVTMLSEGETTVHVRSAYWNDVEASCHLNVSTAVEGLIEDNAPCDVFTTNGVLLKKNANLSEIDRLRPGIYIIRQGQKTTKLLK